MNRRNLVVGGGAFLGLGAATWLGLRQMGSTTTLAKAAADARAPLPVTPQTRDLIRYAAPAANGHNTQPWTFQSDQAQIAILPDFTRRTPVVDPDDHHIFVSLGCAAENLALAAGAAGRAGEIAFDPSGEGAVRMRFGSGRGADRALFEAIPLRQSTRSAYDGSTVEAGDLRLLAKAAVPGVDLILVTDRAQIDRLSDLVIAGNTAQVADPAFMAELKHWLRFSPGVAMATGDGLYSAASGSPPLPEWLGPRAFDLFFTAKAENEKYARQIASSAGIAVFIGAAADPGHWVQVGRACQRFALQATALGLKHAFLNQPVEVADLRPELGALVGVPGRRCDLVMRFGRAKAMPFSMQRPLEAVMT